MRTRVQRHRGAFTLIEIVVTVAIIATVVVTLIGMLPVGIQSAEESANQTVIASVLEDVHNRLEGEALVAGPLPSSPFFYDRQGVFVAKGQGGQPLSERIYRADVVLVKIDAAQRPPDTSGLMAVKIDIWWPLDSKSGEPLRSGEPQGSVTFNVVPLTGAEWQVIDPEFQPKIEF